MDKPDAGRAKITTEILVTNLKEISGERVACHNWGSTFAIPIVQALHLIEHLADFSACPSCQMSLEYVKPGIVGFLEILYTLTLIEYFSFYLETEKT